jgi:hypothetical protein
MKSSAAKFVSAMFATVLAGSPLYAAPETEEKEKPADTCLLAPSVSVPPGGHWYYRYDRVNKRNCWYLGDAKGKSARKQVADRQASDKPAAEDDAIAAEKPAAPAPKKPATRSITDARAEFQPPQTSVAPDSKATATPWPAVTPPDAQRADEPRKVVTTRWPEPAAASPPAPAAESTAPAAQPQIAQPQAAAAPAQPQVAQAQQPQTQTQATPAAPPRPAALPAVKTAAAADQPMSLPMLLTVLVGGLSVIGVLVSAMFGRKKSRPQRLSRSAPMPPLDIPETPRPQQPHPEQARTPDDATRRLQEMLAEIQRRAAA